MFRKALLLVCLSLILSACGSSVTKEDIALQVALTVEANNKQIPAADVPVINFAAEEPAKAATEVSTATPLPLPTATTVPSPTPLPVITDYELINYYYPVRGEILIEVEIPGYDGDLVGKLNGEALECEFSEDKADHLICTGSQKSYYNATLYLLVPGTEHVALEFVIYLSPYEVAICGHDLTGTWTGIDSYFATINSIFLTQVDCQITGYARFSGENSTHNLWGYVSGGHFIYEQDVWGVATNSYDLIITGDHMEGTMHQRPNDFPPGAWSKYDRVSNTP